MGFYNLLLIGLKSISQVLLVENTVSGFIILVAIGVADYKLAIIIFLSGIIGSMMAYYGGGDKDDINQGLYGFSSVLCGMALFIFLESPNRWIFALLLAAFSSVYTAAMNYIFKKINIPAFTFPFITLTWTSLFAGYHLSVIQLSSGLLPQSLLNWDKTLVGNLNILEGVVSGIGQIFFQTNFWVGLLIILAIFWDNWKIGIYAIVGSIVGFIVAYILGANYTAISSGLYGYNAVLTMVTMQLYRKDDNSFKLITIILATAATVVVTASINTILVPYGIPTLTMPFVLIIWIFIGAKQVLPKI